MLTEQVGTQDQEKVFTFTIQPETGLSYRLLNNNSSRQRDVVVACWDYIESSALKGNSGLQGVENIVGKILRNQLDLWVCVDKDQIVGNQTRVKVVKNKVAPPFKITEFDILYGEGISKEGEIIDLGVAEGFVEKSGSWYSFNGNRIGQGRENAKKFLLDNKEIADEIEGMIRKKNSTSEEEQKQLEEEKSLEEEN